MNKRAAIFMPLLVLFTLILYTWTFEVVSGKSSYTERIGENQLYIYHEYYNAENALLYVDEASKQAAYNTIFEIAKNGGYYNEINECGSVIGYNIWYSKGRDCSPKIIKDEFIKGYKNELNELLKMYEVILLNDISIRGLRDFYDISVREDERLEITGKSREDYLFGRKEVDRFKMKYPRNPDFVQIIGYNFLDYNELRIVMTDAIRLCKDAECFNSRMDKKQYQWSIVDRDNYVLFDVNTKKRISNQDVVVKFAVEKD